MVHILNFTYFERTKKSKFEDKKVSRINICITKSKTNDNNNLFK